MKWFYRICYTFARCISRLLYRNKVYGLDHLPKGRALLAPNHASHFDPPLVAVSLREEVHFLARKTLFDIPVIGWIITRLNTHPVGGTGASLESFRAINQLLAEEKKVMVFPEGTRTRDGELQEAAAGVGMIAQRSQAPIIPIYIEGTYDVWSRHRSFPRLWGRTSCSFGEPIDPHAFDHLGRKEAQRLIAEEVMKRIRLLKQAREEASPRRSKR